MLPSPQGRPGYPLTSKAKAKHEGHRGSFLLALRCVFPAQRAPSLSNDFLHFSVSFFLLSDLCFPFLFPFLLFLCSLPRKV